MKILIPGMVPPSPNELRRKYRHPHAYRRLRDTWQQAIVGMTWPSDRTTLKNSGYIHDDSPQWLSLLSPIYLPSTRKAKRTEIQIFPEWDPKRERGNGDRVL